MIELKHLLAKHQQQFADILPSELLRGPNCTLDLSSEQSPFQNIDANNVDQLIQITQKIMEASNAKIAIGHYGENRQIYQRSDLFKSNQEWRSVHLGMDLSVPINTPVFSPFDAVIHSFKNNNQIGDYGPTIVLQHQLENLFFYTLYGHLSEKSLENKSIGQAIAKGEPFAWVGSPEENGRWPVHLHFQIIDNMGNYFGDFPGAIEPSKKGIFLQRCPDPNLILGLNFK